MPSLSQTPAARRVQIAPDPSFRYALIGIGVVTLIRLMWLAGHPIDLYPDEAQYWIWAQHPDWGYYSKPPFVAWMIAATTGLFGENDLAVKIGAPFAYIGTSVLVYLIAARLYSRRIAAWSAIAFVTLPAVSLSSVVISTDVPLLFFWALATYGFIRAREADRWPWWVLAGVACGFGLLSKYAMGYWLLSALGFLVFIRDERRHLRYFLGAALLAALVYLPNFWWNWAHGFVSYAETGRDANVHGAALHPLAFLAFLGSQFAVFGPVFFATLIWIAITGRRALADRRALLLVSFALPTLAFMLVVAMLSRANANWSAPTYLTATILVVAFLSERGSEAWVQWSVVLHVVLAVVGFGAHGTAERFGWSLPSGLDPLHRVIGWQRLGQSLSEIRAQNPALPLLGDERELMADLIYYMQPHPFGMLIWNPGKRVQNGFQMSQSLPDQPGGDYLWITNRTNRDEMYKRFAGYEQVAHVLVPLGPGLQPREAWVYAMSGFKGYADKPAATAAATTPEAAAQ
jgi:4-amino-4-deoxy-L-arabinose transferase-like glycosyltransferase